MLFERFAVVLLVAFLVPVVFDVVLELAALAVFFELVVFEAVLVVEIFEFVFLVDVVLFSNSFPFCSFVFLGIIILLCNLILSTHYIILKAE